MSKHNPTKAVPLIKRPIAEILAPARAAGRAAIEGNDELNGTVSALERKVKDEQFQVQCAQEMFVWLASIFAAIQRAADACPDIRSGGEIKRLAGCGQYLADDRADMLSGYVGNEDAEASHG
jgi:hypothetical protein